MTKKLIISISVVIIILMSINLTYYKIYGEGATIKSTASPAVNPLPEVAPTPEQKAVDALPEVMLTHKQKTERATKKAVEETKKKEEENTVDGTIKGAQDFLNAGSDKTIDETALKSTSNFIYNLLLAFAMVTAVIVGMILGIQFMTSSIDEKAKIKEALVPYVVSCLVIFGAFGIWKLAVTIMSKW